MKYPNYQTLDNFERIVLQACMILFHNHHSLLWSRWLCQETEHACRPNLGGIRAKVALWFKATSPISLWNKECSLEPIGKTTHLQSRLALTTHLMPSMYFRTWTSVSSPQLGTLASTLSQCWYRCLRILPTVLKAFWADIPFDRQTVTMLCGTPSA